MPLVFHGVFVYFACVSSSYSLVLFTCIIEYLRFQFKVQKETEKDKSFGKKKFFNMKNLKLQRKQRQGAKAIKDNDLLELASLRSHLDFNIVFCYLGYLLPLFLLGMK